MISLREVLPFAANCSRCMSRVASVLPHSNITEFNITNEPILGNLPGSPERIQLDESLAKFSSQVVDVPIVIGDEELRTGEPHYQVMPHNHAKKIAKFYYATPEQIQKAIDVSLSVRADWERVPLQDKIQMFLKAADLMITKYRGDLNATTMLGQAKTIIQAEIDAAAELIDFFKFNCLNAKELDKFQPISEHPSVTQNFSRFRGIEGFIGAVCPFNFTAIGGHLASAPALMGNVVLWKPSDTAVLSNYTVFKILQEVGVPPGVINFLPAEGKDFGDTITASEHLAAINFTGSVPTFQHLWKQVGNNIASYRNFPRLIGECGGKNYHLVHPTADVQSVAASTIRSAFEYSGQKCSACSRMYVPASIWPQVKAAMLEIHSEIKLGEATDVTSFMSAVIDERAFDRIAGYIAHAKHSASCTVVAGGGADKSVGYYIEPTIVEVTDPHDKIMTEEIFGPVLSVHVYPDEDVNTVPALVRDSVKFGLTGAIYSYDEAWLRTCVDELKMSAGNFYINDKSTGSVVGQQPFGGGRISGTNDKAGGPHYLLRWANPQSIKETYVPIHDWKYPYMMA
jgi:1-pyrroline-5-carboxylate dehydrogenase